MHFLQTIFKSIKSGTGSPQENNSPHPPAPGWSSTLATVRLGKRCETGRSVDTRTPSLAERLGWGNQTVGKLFAFYPALVN